eukprot:s180_g21.t1
MTSTTPSGLNVFLCHHHGSRAYARARSAADLRARMVCRSSGAASTTDTSTVCRCGDSCSLCIQFQVLFRQSYRKRATLSKNKEEEEVQKFLVPAVPRAGGLLPSQNESLAEAAMHLAGCF